MSDTLFKAEKRELTVLLNGKPEGWYRAARRRRLLEVEWDGHSRKLARRPRDLVELV
jgi:hypothetical protein